jgi:hypothetical protein
MGPFAGRWGGSASFSDAPNVPGESIVVSIPPTCEHGKACGQIENTTIRCTWEMGLLSLEGDVLRYKFSQTLSGDCEAAGTGTLTFQADGRLLREHLLGSTTVVGALRRLPDEP